MRKVVAVEIIGIEDDEFFIHDIAAGAKRVRGTPRLCTFRRSGKSVGKIIRVLEGIFDLYASAHAGTDGFLEFFQVFLLDDKDDLIEAGTNAIVYRIIDNKLAVMPDRVDLFKTAVTAAQTGSENDSCHYNSLCDRRYPIISFVITSFFVSGFEGISNI